MSHRDFRQLMNSVRKTERSVIPDPSWVAQNRIRLLSHASSNMPKEVSAVRSSAAEIFKGFVPTQLFYWMRRPAMAFLYLFAIMLGGSFASVSASERSLPGDFLYPVKLATEQTRFALTGDSSEKLRLKTESVQRRVDEIRQVATQPMEHKQERIKAAAENLKRDLYSAKQQLTDVSAGTSPKATLEAAKLLDEQSSAVVQGLQEVKESIPAGSKAIVTEAESAAVSTGVKAVTVLIGSKDTPEGAEVISADELKLSIEGKVLALENKIQETSEKLRLSTTSSTISATSTVPALMSSSTASFASTTASIAVANAALTEAKVFIQENKLELVPNKLLEAAQGTADANLVMSSVSSSPAIISGSASTTSGAVAPTSSTPVTSVSVPTSTTETSPP